MANQKFPKVVTPRGSAVWPRLNTPDDKFNKAGVYTCKLAIDADDPDLAKLRAKVEELIEAKHAEIVAELTDGGKAGVAKKVQKADPFKAEEDPETGDETGRILINAKMTASGTGKKGPWTRKPAIFNSKGVLLKNPPMIGSGSTLKLNVELFPYYAANDKTVGVSFRLEAAQLLTLVQGGQRDAAGYGFGEEDGDDVSDMEADTPSFGGDADSDEDDDL